MKFFLVAIFSCIALSYSQIPRKCTTPPTWEARIASIDYGDGQGEFGRYYYDAYNERTSFFEESYENGQEVRRYQQYEFYKLKYSCYYNAETKQCYKKPLTDPFSPIKISNSSRFVDQLVIGTNANEQYGMTVNLWEDFTQYGRVMMEFVNDDGDGDENCLPVSFTEIGQRGVRHQSFYNIVLGVNPEHFLPPEECREICK